MTVSGCKFYHPWNKLSFGVSSRTPVYLTALKRSTVTVVNVNVIHESYIHFTVALFGFIYVRYV